MPPASSEVKEAFDDFERFAARGAWERALKALYTIPEEQALRFVDGEDGFIIPVARKRRAVLAGLSPEGQAAYRLFYDAEAKKLLDEAEGPAELKTLERIYSAYFLTSVGDNAADRLGDLYFEQGRFDRAADCWLAVLRERPDTDLSPALLTVKAALALARAGRRSEFERSAASWRTATATRRSRSAGGRRRPAEQLRPHPGRRERRQGPTAVRPSAAGEARRPTSPARSPPPGRCGSPSRSTAGMTPAELTQWESNPLSGAVPAVAVDGATLFANYLGLRLRGGPGERQDALAVGVVPQPRAARDAGPGPDDRPDAVRDRRLGRATSGAWAATSRTRTIMAPSA